jgi:hypothetical protein
MQFDLRFSTAFWIPLVFILAALTFTLFVYRRTIPASSNLLRRMLAALRYICLAIVLLLLVEPVLALRWTSLRRPTIAVLIDESASMALMDSTSRRSDRVKEIMRMPWISKLQESSNVKIMAFADSLRQIDEDSLASMRFNGDGTDIAAALVSAGKRFATENFAAAILLSDGNASLGENPVRIAQNYPAPIFTVGIGSSRRAKDVMLSQIVTNEIAYTESQLPVEITLSAVGFAGRTARVRVEDAAGTLAEQDVILPADNTQTTVRFNVTPRQLGMNKLTAGVEPQPGETSDLNNRRSAFVRVLESRMRILTIAGAPSAEYEFVKRTLENDKNFTVDGFVQKPGGAFYNGKTLPARPPEWKEVDCLFFIDFPRKDTDAQVITALLENLAAARKPIYWIAGPDLDPARWWSFQNYLPFSSRLVKGIEKPVTMAPDAIGMSHPLGRFAESPEENRELWENLPPIFSSFTNVALRAGAQVIGVSEQPSGRASTPLLVAQKSGEAKCIAMLAHGLWRWNLKLVGIGKEPVAYRHIIIQGVRWLVTAEDTKLVRFSTNKLIYRGGEAVEMNAQVYYEDYRPRTGLRVSANVSGKGFDREVLFEEIGDGLYRGTVASLPGGDYELRGRADFNGQVVGEDASKFSVEPFSVEYLTTAMNETAMRKISEVSGGKFLSGDSLDEFAAQAKFPEERIEAGREIAAWGKLGILVFIVFLLGAEWFLRKRNGML